MYTMSGLTDHVEGKDRVGEVGVILRVLDGLGFHRDPSTFELHQGGVDLEQPEPLHVPHSPTQNLWEEKVFFVLKIALCSAMYIWMI